MADETEKPKDNAVEEFSRHNGRRSRYVLLPMLRSGALAFLAVALATAAAVGFAMPGSEPEAWMVAADSEPGMTVDQKEPRETAHPEEGAEASDDEPGAAAEASDEADGLAPVSEESNAAAEQAAPSAAESGLPSGASGASPAPGSGSEAAAGGSAPDSGHQHSWVPETKTVEHPAEYVDVPHEAEYEERAWTQCNACYEDITGRVSEHIAAHALAGEPADYHTERDRVCVKEAWTEYGVLAKEAWTEKVPTGVEACPCGARR